jgi:hypothetical protein
MNDKIDSLKYSFKLSFILNVIKEKFTTRCSATKQTAEEGIKDVTTR